jgi:hypothetical protein
LRLDETRDLERSSEHQYTNHHSIGEYLQGIPGNGYAY